MICFPLVRSTDSVQLKPDLHYISCYHSLMGLDSVLHVSYEDVKKLQQMIDDETSDFAGRTTLYLKLKNTECKQ